MHRSLVIALLTLGFALVPAAHAARVVVHAGQSIQSAIDAAPPGATIVVMPGVYHETGSTRALTITKNGIHLVGLARRGRPVVLEQAGSQTQGIWVSPADTLDPDDVELPPCGDSGARITRSVVSGFTVQGFEGFGIYLACVDGFDIRDNVARDNHTYAIFPVRSRRGRMIGNSGSGTLTDACIYVGQDERVLVKHNRATDCQIGLQIENSSHVRMTDNVSVGNTAGMIVDILNGRQVKEVSDNRVTGNELRDNNRPNSAPPGEETAGLLPGIGIVLDGADRTLIAGNRITGNQLAGMTLVDFCVDRADLCQGPLDIDPSPDGNRILRNSFEGNTSDVIYLPGAGQGNCFARNRPADLNVLGGPLPSCR